MDRWAEHNERSVTRILGRVISLVVLSLCGGLFLGQPAWTAPASEGLVQLSVISADATANSVGLVLDARGELVGVMEPISGGLELSLPVGRYTIMVIHTSEEAMFLPWEGEVDVEAGKTVTLAVEPQLMSLPGLFPNTGSGSELGLDKLLLSELEDAVRAQASDPELRGMQEALRSGEVTSTAALSFLQMLPLTNLALAVDEAELRRSEPFKLAQRLYQARTETQVQRLVLQALEKIGVGVYSHQGVAIQSGAERGPDDVYLYEFHVKALAKNLLRRQRLPASAYVRMLATWGMPGLNTEMITGNDLSLLLARAWFSRDFADMNAREHLLPLLFLSLSLVHGGTDSLTWEDEFDPLQVLLLSLDLLTQPGDPLVDWGTFQARGRVQSPTSVALWPYNQLRFRLPALPSWRTTLLGPVAEASGRCRFGGDAKGGWGAAQNAIVPWDKLGSMGSALGNYLSAMNVISAGLLTFSYKVSVEVKPATVHYGHQRPAMPAAVTAVVEFLDDYSDVVTDCGWMVGLDMPKQGPVQDVEVSFEFSDELLEHGRPGFGTEQETDAQGRAFAEFTPNMEDPIGVFQNEASGTVTARARVQSWLNIGGKIGDYLFPKEDVARIWVSWHEPKPQEPGQYEQRPFEGQQPDRPWWPWW